jgi:hypothetical protein
MNASLVAPSDRWRVTGNASVDQHPLTPSAPMMLLILLD